MDSVEARRNLKLYGDEITKYQNLSRSLLSRDEMIMIDNKIRVLKERIKTIRSIHHA